jgi:hypothetical protein
MGQPGVTKCGLLRDVLRIYLKDSRNQIRARGIPFAPLLLLSGLLQKRGTGAGVADAVATVR